MERVPVNAKNRPLSEIRTTHASVASAFRNPHCTLTNVYANQVTIHANPIADADLAGR